MLIAKKNKIFTLLLAILCILNHADITIPVNVAYKQLTDPIIYSSEQTSWWLEATPQIFDNETTITISLIPHANPNLAYDEITIPQSPTPLQIKTLFPVELTATVATPQGGYVGIVNKNTNQVTLMKIDYQEGSLSNSKSTLLEDSNASGKGLALSWSSNPSFDSLIAYWNCSIVTGLTSQFALCCDDFSYTHLSDGFLNNNFSNTLFFAEVPRVAYSKDTHTWVITQTGYDKNNKCIGSVYGSVSVRSNCIGHLHFLGEVPPIEGKPSMVLEVVALDDRFIGISAANSSNYTSTLSTGQIYVYGSPDTTQLNPFFSFDTRSVFQRILIKIGPNGNQENYFLALNKKYEFSIIGFSDVSTINESLKQNSEFNQQLCENNSNLDALTFALIPVKSTASTQWVLSGALTEKSSRTHSKLIINLSNGTNRLKTHTLKTPNSSYTTKLKIVSLTSNPQDKQQYLQKKYQTLKPVQSSTNLNNFVQIKQNLVTFTTTFNPYPENVITPYYSTRLYNSLNQHSTCLSCPASLIQELKTLQPRSCYYTALKFYSSTPNYNSLSGISLSELANQACKTELNE